MGHLESDCDDLVEWSEIFRGKDSLLLLTFGCGCMDRLYFDCSVFFSGSIDVLPPQARRALFFRRKGQIGFVSAMPPARGGENAF